MFTLNHLAKQLGLELYSQSKQEQKIRYLVTDSRNIIDASGSLFFALLGARRSGMDFLFNAYAKGVRNFILPQPPPSPLFNSTICVYPNPVELLQKIAQKHREQFSLPIIAITGSRGKTTLKEYLSIILSEPLKIITSPHSFNSQIGVPLSVWQIQAQHQLGIFEVGISQSGEMAKLQEILRPQIGILTNLDATHDEGFTDRKSKLQEKLKLFHSVKTVIFSRDIPCFSEILDYLEQYNPKAEILTWSNENQANNQADFILNLDKDLQLHYRGRENGLLQFPFYPQESHILQHIGAILCVLTCLKLPISLLNNLFDSLENLSNLGITNLEGLHNCSLLIPNYSHSLNSLKGSMLVLFTEQSQANSPQILPSNARKKILIISDFPHMDKDKLQALGKFLETTALDYCICIGEYLAKYPLRLPYPTYNYVNIYDFLKQINQFELQGARILLQGDQHFQFNKIRQFLINVPHNTCLEVKLQTMNENLTILQKPLKKSTKIMLMVKSDAYGSGIGNLKDFPLFSHIDYLGVAFINEGIELRNNDISLPIMVMNPDPAHYDTMLHNRLEPEIFSLGSLRKFVQVLESRQIYNYPVHIKVDTGMHRLGFTEDNLPELIEILLQYSDFLRVSSIFSHLVGSETASFDNFTQEQARRFQKFSEQIQNILPYPTLRHIANTQAILRHSNLQMDMVRIGIGLYGIDLSGQETQLKNALSFVTSIAQIKNIARGEAIGYGAKGKITRDTKVATLRVGYADGYPRFLGNGVGKVYLYGKLAPTLGDICMDMTMIDITDIPEAKEDDTVELFGDNLPISQVATWAKTIPYELLTMISTRVQRRYIM